MNKPNFFLIKTKPELTQGTVLQWGSGLPPNWLASLVDPPCRCEDCCRALIDTGLPLQFEELHSVSGGDFLAELPLN
jgi:hypothetical protein